MTVWADLGQARDYLGGTVCGLSAGVAVEVGASEAGFDGVDPYVRDAFADWTVTMFSKVFERP